MNEPIIASSEQEANTYFIFREDSKLSQEEVKIRIVEKNILYSQKLLLNEMNFLRERYPNFNFIKCGTLLNFTKTDKFYLDQTLELVNKTNLK